MIPYRSPEFETRSYDRRLKVFIAISLASFLVCVVRLAQMQLAADASLQAEIAALHRGSSKQLKTLRGRILDRHGRTIAADVPRFQICLSYRLSCYLDERVRQAKLLDVPRESTDPARYKIEAEIDDRRDDVETIIETCTQFEPSRAELEATIRALNDRMWNLRSFLAWRRGEPDPNLIAKYGKVSNVPLAEALAHFARQAPEAERLRLTAKVDDLPEMEEYLPLVELTTDEDVFQAQLGFLGMEGVQVVPVGRRHYPYGSVAAQTIGWVGSATQERQKQERDQGLFAGDPLARYLADEDCGREDGVEYVCESILRGRRGELVYDIDEQLIRRTETQFGADVQLTLDIELQKRIEEHLRDPQANPGYWNAPMAAAVIEIPAGEILALVSLPSYDLNRARYDYGTLRDDPNRPLTNRTINYQRYPPGSVTKPLILIAGLESGVVRPDEVVSCPAAPAPEGWPDCLIYRRHHAGHDGNWLNNARNALKGSCNIYFSRLADRIEPRVLQQWLFDFGYGREVPLEDFACADPGPSFGPGPRRFQQVPGQIGSDLVPAYTDIESLDQIPLLSRRDKIQFGIGQGNFRVTPVQVANAFATLARGGRYQPPRLFLRPASQDSKLETQNSLQLSATTLQTVLDGMSAVVNERGGTAYEAFAERPLSSHGVKVYGKTGSTERPYHAWFAGFAENRQPGPVTRDPGHGPRGPGHAGIALAVVVEGGEHGSSDAAPLARDILHLCLEAGYLGDRDR